MDEKTLDVLSKSDQEFKIGKDKLLTLSPDKKEEYVDKIVISYPLIKDILKDMDECMSSSKQLNEIKCMFISGESRHGKGTITSIFRKLHPNIVTDEITLKPVLYVRLPSPAFTGSLKSNVLKALGDPFYGRTFRHFQSDDRISRLLEKCKVQLIIFDELQQLVEGNRRTILQNSSDWVKNIIEDCKVSVLLCGLPYSDTVLIENKQLGNRVKIRYELKPFEFNGRDFRDILNTFDKLLPFEEKSNLAQNGTWQRIYIATGGVIGFVKSLLTMSTRMAATESLPCITNDILYKAYNKVLYYLSSDNPFSPTYNLNKAIKDKNLL